MNQFCFILIATLFLPNISYSQNITYPELAAAVKPSKSMIIYDKWIDHGNGQYAMSFKSNVVGIKKAIDKCKDICNRNSLDFNKPLTDESFLASTVESIYDYENLYYSVQAGNSIITKYWFKFPKNTDAKSSLPSIGLKIEEDTIIIVIMTK